MKRFSIGGVHPADNKLSAVAAIKPLDIPKRVSIPLAQHIGAPAKAVVKKGDLVKVGQIIGEPSGFVSTYIHSSVSGKVFKVDAVADSSGFKHTTVIIDVDGDEWIEGIDRSVGLISEISSSQDEIKKAIHEAGIVGLGGATFPTHIKLTPPPGNSAEVLVVNGVECEPYLTSDHRIMLEKAEEVLVGIEILKKGAGVDRAVVGIENNKKDAIALLSKIAPVGIDIVPLRVQYPQGSEKQLIEAAIGKQVPNGALPIAVGAVVVNVATAFACYEAVQKNKPLFETVVTVTGKGVSTPSNFLTRVGTPMQDLVDAAGGVPEDTGKIVNGGPMMGRAVISLDAPILKGSSGILMMKECESSRKEISACIRCAKCVSVCPMGLEPYHLMLTSKKKMWESTENNDVMNCIECGSCVYTCPSNRPLLDYIRLGKRTVGQIIRNRKA